MDLQRLILRMKLHRITVHPVYQCALVLGLLKKHGLEGTIQEGYITFMGQATRHYWVEDQNGTVYDIVTEYARASGAPALPVQLEKTVSEETKVAESPYSPAEFDQYIKDPKIFWAQKPLALRSFKC